VNAQGPELNNEDLLMEMDEEEQLLVGEMPIKEQVHVANLENPGPVDVPMFPVVQPEAIEEVAADNVKNEMLVVADNGNVPAAAEGDIAADAEEGNMDIDNFELTDFLPAIQAQQIDLPPVAQDHNSEGKGGVVNVNLNINMALTNFDNLMPVNLSWAPLREKVVGHDGLLPPNVYRLWAKFFSPVGCPEQVVDIPSDWAPFFTVMLLSPTHFDWAKSFLVSKASDLLLSSVNTNALMAFSNPTKCPKNAEVLCQGLLEAADSSPQEVDSLVELEEGEAQSGQGKKSKKEYWPYSRN
jgi:hypothetical protein